MKNKKTLIAGFAMIVAVLGVGTTVFMLNQNQDVRSHAQVNNSVTPTQACQPPAAVTNVTIDYPYLQGNQSDFNSASCTWDAVTGAVNYQYKVTEVDSGTVVKNDSVAAPTTQVVFPVTQGKTYKCDVNAVNNCGATGGTGSDSLLCKTDAFVSPTVGPSPTSPPGVTPQPTPQVTLTPTAAPQVLVLACGQTPCDATHTCELGLVCVQANNGQSYCAQAAYQTACQQNPSANSCCFATQVTSTPSATFTPVPTIPKPGNSTGLFTIAGGSILLFLIGGALILL